MSSYVRNLKLTIPFDGDDVKLTLRNLELADFNAIVASREHDADMVVISEFAKLLPKYVVEMKGLHDAAGNEVGIEEVCTVTYFAPILGQCFRFLLSEAVLKNRKASDETSTASSSETKPTTGSIQAVSGHLIG